MVRLWGILRKKHKIMQDVVVEVDRADLEGAREAVDLCCYQLDIPRPLWLPKHEADMSASAARCSCRNILWKACPSTALRWSFSRNAAEAGIRETIFPKNPRPVWRQRGNKARAPVAY